MNIFLFAVDLEDVRMRMKNANDSPERFPQMIQRYLDFLEKYRAKCTFFVTGDVAEKYPHLIQHIDSGGHEIACHSFSHITLDKMNKESFRNDLKKNMEAIRQTGVKEIHGYRAPVFSLTEKTSWAYQVLSEEGFFYSSSVLPAKNPLFGWKEFGTAPRKICNLWEIPMTVSSFGAKKIPFGGGVYFRVLPFSFIKKSFRKHFQKKIPITGYFHPYDIDSEEKYFPFPEIKNALFSRILLMNRHKTLPRLEKIFSMGIRVMTYHQYALQLS